LEKDFSTSRAAASLLARLPKPAQRASEPARARRPTSRAGLLTPSCAALASAQPRAVPLLAARPRADRGRELPPRGATRRRAPDRAATRHGRPGTAGHDLNPHAPTTFQRSSLLLSRAASLPLTARPQ